MNRGLSLEQLAHELNSKLDSSMRTLTLAEQALSRHTASGTSGLDDVASRLRRARAPLCGMADLLDRALAGGSAFATLTDGRLLGRCVDDILAELDALAEKNGVDLDTWVSPNAAELPAGPLGTVIENGLRNAIEACVEAPGRLRRVRMRVEQVDAALVLKIHDSGAGVQEGSTKPGGHGLGLGISRMIVAELGGTLRLSNHPAGTGALFEVGVPLSALEAA